MRESDLTMSHQTTTQQLNESSVVQTEVSKKNKRSEPILANLENKFKGFQLATVGDPDTPDAAAEKFEWLALREKSYSKHGDNLVEWLCES